MIDKRFRIRLAVVFVSIGLICASVVLRSAYLMLLPSEQLSTLLKRQFPAAPAPVARRGNIYDRNSKPLAISMNGLSLFANPNKIRNKARLSLQLSKILSIKKSDILRNLLKKRDFVWIKRHLHEKEVVAVRKLFLKNRRLRLYLRFANESKRFYPNQEMAAHLLGFIGTESKGLEGLEYYYDKELSGRNSTTKNILEGESLVLTIDKVLQNSVESSLKSAVEQRNAKSGSIVVMDADTGEVWAMASWPRYNPNNFRVTKAQWRRNRSTNSIFEPGSTLKPLLISGAMNSKMINPKSKFHGEEGRLKIGNYTVRESDREKKWKWLTVEEIIQKSSNIGAAKIGFKYGRGNLYNWYKKIGLTNRTRIDLPGEARGLLRPARKWSEIAFSNIAFGQGISVTPIQILRAYAAIANGGYRVRPYLVKRIEDSEGRVRVRIKSGKGKRLMRSRVARQVTEMLHKVTQEDGTGTKAAIEGFNIAGKTGTAQIAERGKGYATKKFVASFVGFPMDVKPRFVAMVTISEPEFPHTSGGEVAAPVFKEVMSSALARAGIKGKALPYNPLSLKKKLAKQKEQLLARERKRRIPTMLSDKKRFLMPDLLGVSAREVLDLMDKKSVQLEIKGRGIVVKQHPLPGSLFQKGVKVSINLEPKSGN